MSFFAELKRRNVIRVGAAYVVVAWLLIQVAETIFPLFGFGDGPARLVVVLLAIGFVPVLVVSWAFEITPEGVKREREVDRAHSITAQTGKKLDRVIMAVLAAALAVFAFDKFVLDPQRDADITESAAQAGAEQAREEARLSMFEEKSVAVLPFVNRSEKKEDEYFTDGMHDELLTRLSRISELKVISRTSVMKFRDTDKTIPEIARELAVAAILEGGVQRSGNQVRINVQLINAHSDEHLWAEIYDRELTTENLFAIQSEISTAIAESLQATLSPEERDRVYDLPTSSLEAYNHYLRGRQSMASRTTEGLRRALGEFEQATEIDPEFALGWVGIADAVHLLFEHGGIDRFEHQALHKEAAEKALALNDQLGEAYTSLAFYYLDVGEREKAKTAILKAIELNPNYAQAYHWYANILGGQERDEKRLSVLYKAAQLDPLSSVIQVNLAGELVRLGRPEDARHVYQQLARTDPRFAPTYTFLADIEMDYGRIAEAARLYRKAVELDPGSGRTLQMAARPYLAVGDFETVKKIIDQIDELLGPDNEPAAKLRWDLLLAQSKPQESVEYLDSFPPAWKKLWLIDWAYMWSWMHVGDFEKSREYLLKVFPHVTEREQWQQQFADSGNLYCPFAGILIRAGDTSLGHDLLDFFTESLEARETTASTPGGRENRALCYLIAGSYDQALEIFSELVAQGHLIGHWSFQGPQPWWELIRDDPRYLALVGRIEAALAEQRKLLNEQGPLGSSAP
ncbi:MAG: hypothetical protein AMJ65_07980 [Phycisphaerae bacterium SG8_4]|nr:MAG: hypothetical protein AMJ65_07980 [Phycisphaerae bacterium SG8_4]